jgi:hypothetical protein
MDQTQVEEQEAQEPLFLSGGRHRASSESTESDTGPETPEDEPFDPATQPRPPALPKSPIRRRRSMSVKSTTKVPKTKTKTKGPTATQVPTPFKPKPKPKKRVKSIDPTTGPKVVPKKTSKGEKKSQGASPTAVGAEAKKGGAGLKGNKVINRVAPQTLAAADP